MSGRPGGGGGRRRAEEHEEAEHENGERWLLSYADMITLLMVLFIVLFSISQVDLAKFEKFKAGLAESETARCCEIWERKFGEVATDPEGRNKQMRFLLQRGFSQRAIRTAMKGTADFDE